MESEIIRDLEEITKEDPKQFFCHKAGSYPKYLSVLCLVMFRDGDLEASPGNLWSLWLSSNI